MNPYRGWTKEGKKEVRGWYFKRGKDSYIINVDGFSYLRSPTSNRPLISAIVEDAHFREVIPETVGQAIGFQDIYQSDIIKAVRISTGEEITGEIVWDAKKLLWGVQMEGWIMELQYLLNAYEIKVIGNRIDNPDLLEQDNG